MNTLLVVLAVQMKRLLTLAALSLYISVCARPVCVYVCVTD